ncbi:hypothetical protein C0995_004811, partial [Termitomyces sp. Mi166
MLVHQARAIIVGAEAVRRSRGPSGLMGILERQARRRCTKSLTKTADGIIEKIDRAFDAGEVLKELLQSIAILSALSDRSYAHIQSIISRDLANASDGTKYGPPEIRRFLEGEQTLIDADRSGTGDVILAVGAVAKGS